MREEKSELQEIKERIYDEELIKEILEELECENIHEEQDGDLIVAKLPSHFNSNNRRAVQVKNNEKLTSYIRNKGIRGDIYTIIGYILFDVHEFDDIKINLYEIKAWLCNLFDWEEYMTDFVEVKKKPKIEWNSWLKPLLNKRKVRENLSHNLHKTNKPIDKNIMNRYIQKPHYQFLKDGINCKTQKIFEVAYDKESQRVIYPIYDNEGLSIVGIKGRYIGNNKRVAEEMKYLFLIPCDKSILLFNLHRAKPFVKEKGEVLVFESAKSCMLAYQYGFKNCVSIEGNELSNVQAFLLKQLDSQIVFCFDKDIERDHVLKQAKLIRNRLCFAIFDHENHLGEKDAPVDKGKKVFELLYLNFKEKLLATENKKEK